jgi:hypothetical protein
MIETKKVIGATAKDAKILADLKELVKKGYTVKFNCEAKFSDADSEDDNIWVSYCVAVYSPESNPEVDEFEKLIPIASYSDGSVHFYAAVDEDETMVHDFCFWD